MRRFVIANNSFIKSNYLKRFTISKKDIVYVFMTNSERMKHTINLIKNINAKVILCITIRNNELQQLDKNFSSSEIFKYCNEILYLNETNKTNINDIQDLITNEQNLEPQNIIKKYDFYNFNKEYSKKIKNLNDKNFTLYHKTFNTYYHYPSSGYLLISYLLELGNITIYLIGFTFSSNNLICKHDWDYERKQILKKFKKNITETISYYTKEL